MNRFFAKYYWIVKSRRIKWEGNVALIREMRGIGLGCTRLQNQKPCAFKYLLYETKGLTFAHCRVFRKRAGITQSM
jgi:hypothetical protein